MAKRSDFAQKLLDDLRLRKERMAAASQTSNRSKTTTIDAYSYSKQIHRGSKNTKTHGMSVPKTGNTINTKYGGSNKSPMTNDTSNQIVPYTRDRNSEQIGDLSMALAFALENGGKLRGNASSGNNLMLGFLQQIGRRSFQIGKMNKRGGLDRNHNVTGYFPTISHLHIKEISKGAHKLNQILRTCSNGSDFGKCSIEIGQELLKGAMDLEESLRMLVNLHEASEHVISPQQKNRIVLLENEEDAEENKDEALDQKLYQPRFSLEKLPLNSRSSQEVKGNGHNQKLATLRYTAEGGNFNQEEQPLTTVKLSFHRRSATCGHDVRTSNTREKVGISNVIAKLMGLDNLSDNSNYAHKDSGSKQKVTQKDLQPSTRGITKKAEPRTNITESRSNSGNPKPTISDKNSTVVNTIFVSQGMNDFPTNDASLRAITFSGKSSWKGIEGVRPQTSPSTPTLTIFNQQNKDEIRQKVPGQEDHLEELAKQLHIKNRDQSHRDEHREVLKKRVLQKDNRDDHMKHPHQKHRELNIMERDQKRGERRRNGMQQIEAQLHKKSEHAIILQGYKKRTNQLEKRHQDKLQSRMHQQIPNSPKYQQPPVVHKAEMGNIYHHVEELKQRIGKQTVQERNQKTSGITSKSLTKPVHGTFAFPKKQQDMSHVRRGKKSCNETITAQHSNVLPNNRCPENDNSRENNCYALNDKTSKITHKSVEQNSSSRDSEMTFEVMEKQDAREPVKNELKSTKMQKSEGLIINQTYAMKQQNPTVQEVEQEKHEKLDVLDGLEVLGANESKEVEAHLVESRETVAIIQPLNGTPNSHEEDDQVLTLPVPADDECHILKEPQISAPKVSCQKTISTNTSNKEEQRSVFGRGEISSSKIVTNAVEEAEQYNMNTLYPPHLAHLHSFSKTKQETLTERENQLKQTLITSEWFLNAAEALFKLNIPSFILHDSCHHSHLKNGRNFTVDCSYEVMKRKGIRQELSKRPCTNISLRSKKIESLDDLIKQLHRDIEALKFYGRNGNPECEVQDYLPRMLESDIYNQEPDFNSMWDLGWNETTFVFFEREEVVKDVEKHILSGLIDDITRDLVHVCHLLTKRSI
ncbi:uncharacterized protein LOC101209549 isoform X1 [Cucumis sativus]|uniref:DUF3741 domain-containing protein n=2 Tax=Cucumis sativus TaxID=3659 RepID=A0A0A0LD84_CUCSA|nr:uncharacterized protein LOC101209549 isoform X1 [Cucumis sativus]KGN59950.1 hypothetical protein Csa_001421 [Cucumis sativus]